MEFQQGWTLGPGGKLFLLGSASSKAILRGGQATLNGLVEVNRTGRIEAPATFRPTGMYSIPDGNDLLELAANTTVQPGADFEGNGAVANLNGSSLTMNIGSDIGVHLRNEGLLRFGAGLGTVDLASLELANGTMQFRLGGTDVSHYDHAIVLGNAEVGAGLDVSLASGFNPSLNDAFVLLQSTTGFVVGQFDTVDLPAIGSELAWQVDYSDPLTVWLRVIQDMISGDFDGNGDYACNDVDMLVGEIVAGTNSASFDLTGDGNVNGADLTAWLAEAGAAELGSGNPYLLGDANLDGNVNGADFLVWNANKFTGNNGWCGGDFDADGNTNGADFLVWNANKFTSADGVSAVPEPGSPMLLLLAAFAILQPLRSRFV